MNKTLSKRLTEQAERAERLADAVMDEAATTALRQAALQYREQAARIDEKQTEVAPITPQGPPL